MKPIKFKTILTQSPPPHSGYHFVRVEAKIGEKFAKKDGSRRVVCRINGAEGFQCALMPSGGQFLIMVSKDKRAKIGIIGGARITVELEADNSKYGVPMPAELKEVLKQDPEGDRLFHSLSAGKQRSMIFFISRFKGVDRRIHSALNFIEHLKSNDGKIVEDKLQAELKRPVV